MIKAAFGDNSLWICGHSGHSPKGQDIVCAAVSILSEATAAALKARDIPAIIVRGDGFFACAAGSGGDMMEPARQGLLLLARHYGDNVEVRDLRTGRERHA